MIIQNSGFNTKSSSGFELYDLDKLAYNKFRMDQIRFEPRVYQLH